jgi:hypothetical protein
VTHPTGPVVSWSSSRGVQAEPPSSQVIPGAASPLIRCTPVVLWVSSEIRAFWGSISRMICRRYGPGEWRISEHEVAPVAGNPTDHSGRGLDVNTGQMPVRHGRCGARPGLQIPLRCLVRHRVQLFSPGLRGTLTAVSREFLRNLRIDIVAGQRPMMAIVALSRWSMGGLFARVPGSGPRERGSRVGRLWRRIGR